MPIPYRQVEQNFFKRLVQRGKEIFTPKREKIGETTIVRPDFHHEYIDIEKQVYIQLITYCCAQDEIVNKVEHVQFLMEEQVQTNISVQLKMPINYLLPDRFKRLQEVVQQSFHQHFGFELDAINIYIKTMQKKRK